MAFIVEEWAPGGRPALVHNTHLPSVCFLLFSLSGNFENALELFLGVLFIKQDRLVLVVFKPFFDVQVTPPPFFFLFCVLQQLGT